MKMLITLLSVCLLAASPHSRADVRLPKSTFTTDRMEEALKTAKEQKKPVAYLYTNTATTCPLAAGASDLFCVNVTLPLATTNASQGQTTTATFTFDAEQTANNP